MDRISKKNALVTVLMFGHSCQQHTCGSIHIFGSDPGMPDIRFLQSV